MPGRPHDQHGLTWQPLRRADVEELSRRTGRSRLIVTHESRYVGLVHVRDAVTARATGTNPGVVDLRQQMPTLRRELPLIDAATQMRQHRVGPPLNLGDQVVPDGELARLREGAPHEVAVRVGVRVDA